MGFEVFVSATHLVVAILMLMLAYEFAFVPAMMTAFRQRLFAIRRALFLLAVKGVVAFDDPAYVRLRETINGMMRFAERATLGRMVYTLALADADAKREVAGPTDIDRAIATSSPEARKALESVRNDIGLAMLRHVFGLSPLGWVLFVFAFAGCFFYVLFNHSQRSTKDRIGRRIEPVAEALAQPTELEDQGAACAA